MKVLIRAAQDWNIALPDDSQATAVLQATTLSPSIAKKIDALWKAAEVQKVWDQRNKLQLPGGASSTEYFFEHALRFAKEDFVPTQDDMLRVKQKTTGVSETAFEVNTNEFVMVDVGGQRSERRKWLQCFTDVSSVIYLVALNEYDMVMEEDGKTNRMEESVKLFQKLSGSQWLKETTFILFLNKCDLFKTKIKTRPLKNFFEDYDEFTKGLDKADTLSDYDKSVEYIKRQYENAFNGTRLYTYVTCALDTENCVRIFESVRDTVIEKAFNAAF